MCMLLTETKFDMASQRKKCLSLAAFGGMGFCKHLRLQKNTQLPPTDHQ